MCSGHLSPLCNSRQETACWIKLQANLAKTYRLFLCFHCFWVTALFVSFRSSLSFCCDRCNTWWRLKRRVTKGNRPDRLLSQSLFSTPVESSSTSDAAVHRRGILDFSTTYSHAVSTLELTCVLAQVSLSKNEPRKNTLLILPSPP